MHALQDSGSRQGPFFAHICATGESPVNFNVYVVLGQKRIVLTFQPLHKFLIIFHRMSIRSRHEDDDRRTGEQRERKERRGRSEQEWQAPRRRDSHVNRPRTDLGDSSDSDSGGERMMMPFRGGDSGGMNLFSGFQRPRPTMGNRLSPGAQYTGQLYASQGVPMPSHLFKVHVEEHIISHQMVINVILNRTRL